jgi:COPII coat assembly protein SEC16
MPPPSGPGRTATPPRSDSPALDGVAPPPMLSSSVPSGLSGPPSRPGTSMSNASSIDDLLGAPAARKGGAKKGKKGRGYVDVMAKN